MIDGDAYRIKVNNGKCYHGSHCSCRALARAMGIPESSIDFNYCRNVLQKHWRVNCDHLPVVIRARPNIQLPPHDSDDPVQLALIANAEQGSDDA